MKFIEKYNKIIQETNNKFKKQTSAGILIYRKNQNGQLEVLLGKNGGPDWDKKNVGAWNIPKGHVQNGETLKQAAVREFQQETSIFLDLKDIVSLQYLGMNSTKSGKNVHIFALEKDLVPGSYKVQIKSNMCKTEYPKGSGNIIQVPELSQAYYFKLNTAKNLIFSYQKFFLNELEKLS